MHGAMKKQIYISIVDKTVLSARRGHCLALMFVHPKQRLEPLLYAVNFRRSKSSKNSKSHAAASVNVQLAGIHGTLCSSKLFIFTAG